MPVIRTSASDLRLYSSVWLLNHARNIYSQSGEDGMLEAIFETIGTTNKWCVEFGAWDGVYLSNTCNLIRNHGWRAVMIESDAARCAEIRANYPGNDGVIPVQKRIGFEKGVDTIDATLAGTGIPQDFDLISIDVDGVDWHIWESIVDCRPRVAIVEFNGQVPNNVVFIQDRDMQLSEGCSLAALIELGKDKGYELIAVTGPNAIFVVKEEFPKFKIDDNSIDAMRESSMHALWSCYNGRIYHTLPRLGWNGKNLPLPPDRLQILAEFRHGGSAVQGRSAPLAEIDLETSEGILRELFTLRGTRGDLTKETFAERHKKAWAAAKAYLSQVR